MAKTASKISAKIAAIGVTREKLVVALAAAQAAEQLQIGNSYLINQGKGEDRKEVLAVLKAQRVNEKGVTEYRFQYGEGFDEKLVDGTSRLLVPAAGATGDSSAKVQSKLDKLADDEEVLEKELADALARETLVVGQTYTIKIGRGESATNVLAVLLGEGVETKSKTVIVDGVEQTVTRDIKQLNFFYGEGFGARTVLVGQSAIVISTAEDEAEAAAEVAADQATVE